MAFVNASRRAARKSKSASSPILRSGVSAVMALATLLLGVQLVLTSGIGAGFRKFLAEEAADLERRNQTLDEKIGVLEQRIRIRSALISDLNQVIQSYAGLSDALEGQDSLQLTGGILQTNGSRRAEATGYLTSMAAKPFEKSAAAVERDFSLRRKNSDRHATEQVFEGPNARERYIDAINAVFDRHRPALQYLYRRALQHNPDLSGRVTLRFRLSSSGRMRELEMVESTLNSSDLSEKILEIVRQWNDFGQVAGSDENRTYIKTFRFGD
jgi:hypothetical protein